MFNGSGGNSKQTIFYFRPNLGEIKLPKTFSAVSPEIRLLKTFSALYLWKSNLNEITGDHANENYEVNMWGKYCKISRICNNKKQKPVLY